jgi:hypothetical protein
MNDGDWQLVKRYVREGFEETFGRLAARHVRINGLVNSCDPNDARCSR